ncbi:MAG TPA: hypothetical protein DHW64_01555 [Chitinophagaceae bacterium]|nr:hypothetical protein [Chitinophagaceae bacterium]
MTELKHIYYLLILSGLFALLINVKKLDRIILLYIPILLSAFVTEKISDYTAPRLISKQVYHYYHFAETILLSVYYYHILNEKKHKIILSTTVLLYLVYCIRVYGLYPENLNTDKRGEVVVQGIIITLASVFYLYELYKDQATINFLKKNHFWLVTVNMIFFAGSLFFNGYTYYLLVTKEKFYSQLSYIMVALNYILYVTYFIVFLCPIKIHRKSY